MNVKTKRRVAVVLACLLDAAGGMSWVEAHAETARQAPITIESQPLNSALRAFSLQTGLQLIYLADLARGRSTRGCAATVVPQEALTQLLAGTGLAFEFLNERTVRIRSEKNGAQPETATRGGAANRSAPGVTGAETSGEAAEEVVVTARKREERLIDVPMAVTVMSGQSLEERGVDAVSEALADVPSLGVIDSGEGLQNINMRGISTLIGSNEIGFYLDELPFTGVTLPIEPDIRAWDIERVEVLRGPQGTLFGEGSEGGTIRTITRDPQFNEWEGKVAIRGSQTAGGGLGDGFKGMLNIPLIADTLALRLDATKETVAGWALNLGTGEKNANSEDISTYRAKLRWQPLDRLTLNAAYWRYEGNFPSSYTTTEQLTVPAGTNFLSKLTLWLGGAWATYDFGPFVGFYSIARNTYNDPGDGVDYDPPTYTESHIAITSQELRFSSNSRAVWEWTAGVFDRAVHRNDQISIQSFGIDNISEAHERSQALFGEVTYHVPGVPLDLSAGVRIARETLEGRQSNEGIPLDVPDTTYPNVDPRFSIAWHSSDRVRPYLSVAKGYRAGQIQYEASLAYAASVGIKLPATLRDDAIWTYELGAKGSLGERLSYEAAAYHSLWNHPAVEVALGAAGIASLVNSGGARTNGVEATLHYAVTSAVALTASGAYTDAQYTQTVPGSGITAGSGVDYISKTSASAALELHQPVFAGLTGYGRLGIQYYSPRPLTSIGPPEELPSNSIVAVTARVGVESLHWSAFVFVNNLTNDPGATSPRQVYATAEGIEALATRMAPRTVGLEFTTGL